MMKKTIHSINTIKRLNIKQKACVNDVDSSEEIDNDSSDEDEVNNFMIMAIDDQYKWSDLNDEETMVDIEGD